MSKNEKDHKSSKKEEDKKLSVEVVRQMITLSTSGFGLVAALAWNAFVQQVVNDYIKRYLPAGSQTISLLLYAIIVTVLAVVVTMQLSKLLKSLENLDRRKK